MVISSAKKIFYVLLVVLSGLLVGCAKNPPAEVLRSDWGKIYKNPTLEEHQKFQDLWNLKKPKHYRYKVKVGCDGALATRYFSRGVPEMSGRGTRWIIIEVSEGQLLHTKNIDGTRNSEMFENLGIYEQDDYIDVAFGSIAGDIKFHFSSIVMYDPNYGFPRFIESNDEKRPTDSYFFLEIVEFEVLPEILHRDDFFHDEIIQKIQE